MYDIGDVVQSRGKKYVVSKSNCICHGCAFYGPDGRCSKPESILNCGSNIFKEIKEESKLKHIKLGKAYIENGEIKVVIEEQSHRCEEFGESGYVFEADNGVVLRSAGVPVVSLDDAELVYVRGMTSKDDSDPLIFTSLDAYNKFVEAVNEYNEYFSKPQVREMTMEEVCKELGYEVKIKKEA